MTRLDWFAAGIRRQAAHYVDNPVEATGVAQDDEGEMTEHHHAFDSDVLGAWVRHPACLYCRCGEFRWVEEFGRELRDRRRLDGLYKDGRIARENAYRELSSRV